MNEINLSLWTGAVFSEDRKYRYALWRRFTPTGMRFMNALMLNPSTADEYQNDPTVHRCLTRAAAKGYDGLIVTNMYALRSTDPKVLKENPEPRGAWNGIYILAAAQLSEIILCGWGNHAEEEWVERTLDMLADCKQTEKLRCLGRNQSGMAAHPLYFPYSAELKPYAYRPQ